MVAHALRGLVVMAAVAFVLLACAVARAQDDGQTVQPLDGFVGILGECDLGARLDNLAIAVQTSPQSKGYVIVYSGKYALPGRVAAYRSRIGDYLINARGLEPERLVVVDGGYRQDLTTELWVVPEGQPAPEPTATIDVNRELGEAYKFDERHVYLAEDFEPVVDDVEVAEETTEEPAVDAAAPEQPVGDTLVPIESLTEEEKAQEATEITSPEETGETAEEKVDWEVVWVNEEYAKALAVETKARGCIIFYANRGLADFGRMQSIAERGKQLLVEKYGVRGERLTLVFGGYQDSPAIELWIVPANASLPVPTPEPEKKNDESGPPTTNQLPVAP